MMVQKNSSPFSTAFTVSIEARDGVTTGISAADRARARWRWRSTLTLAQKTWWCPATCFPCGPGRAACWCARARPRAAWIWPGWQAWRPAAVICEIMNPDGTMARMPQLEAFAKEHKMQIVSVADLINYRLQRDNLVEGGRRARF